MLYPAREKILTYLKFLCLLKTASDDMSLRKVAMWLGIDVAVLSKYLNLHIIPSHPRMLKILSILEEKYDPINAIRVCVSKGVYYFPEMNNLSWKCPFMYYCILHEFAKRLKSVNFDAFVTAEGGGLYISSGLQTIFPRKRLLYAMRDVLVKGGYSIKYKRIPKYAMGPRIKRYLTFPQKRSLRNTRVVIIDDFIRSGDTVNILIKYLDIKGAEIKKIIALSATREAIRHVSKEIESIIPWDFLFQNKEHYARYS